MTLYEEIYFDISFYGEKSELKKMVKFLKSGELDDFFEVPSDYICYSDGYADAEEDDNTEFTFTNDDLGIEVDEFDTDEFLDLICKAGKKLYIRGNMYDSSDEEYSFISDFDSTQHFNANAAKKFNDELDEAAENEEENEVDYEEE